MVILPIAYPLKRNRPFKKQILILYVSIFMHFIMLMENYLTRNQTEMNTPRNGVKPTNNGVKIFGMLNNPISIVQQRQFTNKLFPLDVGLKLPFRKEFIDFSNVLQAYPHRIIRFILTGTVRVFDYQKIILMINTNI